MKNIDANYKCILFYCLGSEYYKNTNKKKFLEAIDRADPKELLNIFERYHIVGLLYDELLKYQANHSFVKLAEPLIEYQKLFNNILLKELSFLSTKLGDSKIHPVILKGPAYWQTLYKNDYCRRVHDLDIMISNLDEIQNFSTLLIEAGFRNVDNNYYSQIYDNNHYELPTFFKFIELQMTRDSLRKLETAEKISSDPLKFELNENNKVLLRIDIELHKSMFRYENGSFPILKDDFFSDYEIVPKFKIMKSYASLPYLSSKFIIDTILFSEGDPVKVKCMKLVADFIKILEKASNSEIIKSIQLAELWGSLKNYRIMLNSVKYLMPEIEFQNLKGIEEFNPLETIIG